MTPTNKWISAAVLILLVAAACALTTPAAQADGLEYPILTRRVPDASTTFQLLGASLAVIEVIRRKLKSR